LSICESLTGLLIRTTAGQDLHRLRRAYYAAESAFGKQALTVLPTLIFGKLICFDKGGGVSKSLQTRLDKLEALYSEQDHTLQTLNDLVAQQSQEISRLYSQLDQIKAQLQSIKTESASEIDSGFEIPPHY
jgi:uncharacterized coiled-coil protein SlyX